jgi:protein-tyrosine phosphatase
MNRIEPGLHLGDIMDARNHAAFERRDVAAVLNVSRSRPDEPYPEDVAVHHVPLVDGATNVYGDFAEAVDTLRELLASERTVFVHCGAGVSRSVAVTTAALAARDGRSPDEALDRVTDRRPVANPHPHLRQQAEEYVETRG